MSLINIYKPKFKHMLYEFIFIILTRMHPKNIDKINKDLNNQNMLISFLSNFLGLFYGFDFLK